MSLKNTLTLLTLIATLLVSQSVDAQVDIPSPRFRHLDVESTQNTRPLAEPGVFNYDAQLFAPLEFNNHDEREPNTGFYFTYDRIYAAINTGNIGGDTNYPTANDYNWGNVWNIGWMTDADDGWGIRYQKVHGIQFVNGQDILVSNPMLVDTDYSTVEINRMFRQSLQRGGYLEPYFGIKYFGVSDSTIEDTTQFLTQTAFNRFKQKVTNSAFGFHAGARYNRQTGRFRTTFDGSVLTAYNQQRLFATDIVTVGAATGVSETHIDDEAFAPAVDFRLEVAYALSRDVAVKVGFVSSYIWEGVARANLLTTNLNLNSNFGTGIGGGLLDGDMLATGFTFGFDWKR